MYGIMARKTIKRHVKNPYNLCSFSHKITRKYARLVALQVALYIDLPVRQGEYFQWNITLTEGIQDVY